MTLQTMQLELDEADYNSIQRAIARRQAFGVMPDFDGNLSGAVLAEICRGWMERLEKNESTSKG